MLYATLYTHEHLVHWSGLRGKLGVREVAEVQPKTILIKRILKSSIFEIHKRNIPQIKAEKNRFQEMK